ncbi:MAG: glycosyltransferase [Planctomycetota bacterium]
MADVSVAHNASGQIDESCDDLSLFICTMNRPDDLRLALQSVADARLRPGQVMVSDDSPDPEMRSKVRAATEAFPGAEYQIGPGQGLGANRNACLSVRRGRAVMFIDDDVVVPPDHFEKVHARLVETDFKAIVSGGEDKQVAADRRAKIRPGRVGFWGTQSNSDQPNTIVINAAAFPAHIFDQAQFDPLLKFGSEEVDIVRRARRLGVPIVYDPGIEVKHNPSLVNRTGYRAHVGASYLYATAKGHLLHDGRPARAAAFLLLGPPRMVAHAIQRHGLKAGVAATWQVVRASGMLARCIATGAWKAGVPVSGTGMSEKLRDANKSGGMVPAQRVHSTPK